LCSTVYHTTFASTKTKKSRKMKTVKKFTSKKLRPCLVVMDDVSVNYVVLSDGIFTAYDHTNTVDSYLNTTVETHWPHEKEAEFIAFFEKTMKNRKEEAERKQQEAKEAEEKRINGLKDRIASCEMPVELATEFGLEFAETAGHWSDLYEGRSGYAVLIRNLEEYEIVQLAIVMHNIEGSWGECKHRAGEHHHNFSNMYGDLSDYQENVKRYYNGDGFFYRSKDSESEYYLEQIKEMDDMEEIAEKVKEWQKIEAGYYDCHGNLEISEDALESPELTGHCYDVYSYTYAFGFAYKNTFNAVEEVEEEEEA
jgi:hypothetical protein